MNETLKNIITENISKFVFWAIIGIASLIVSYQLFQQQTNFTANAQDKRITKLEEDNANRSNEEARFSVLENKVDIIIQSQQKTEEKIDKQNEKIDRIVERLINQ